MLTFIQYFFIIAGIIFVFGTIFLWFLVWYESKAVDKMNSIYREDNDV